MCLVACGYIYFKYKHFTVLIISMLLHNNVDAWTSNVLELCSRQVHLLCCSEENESEWCRPCWVQLLACLLLAILYTEKKFLLIGWNFNPWELSFGMTGELSPVVDWLLWIVDISLDFRQRYAYLSVEKLCSNWICCPFVWLVKKEFFS